MAPPSSVNLTPPPGYIGRGAWPSTGVGGTLQPQVRSDGTRASTTVPGGLYMLAVPDYHARVGYRAWKALSEGAKVDYNDYAVHLGVKAVQGVVTLETSIVVDGVYGMWTDRAVRAWQERRGLPADGIVGRATAKVMFLPMLQRAASIRGVDWRICCGQVSLESAWDPGAVGKKNPLDVGLGQINGPSHPEFTIEERFMPALAVNYVVDRYHSSLEEFDGNSGDAIASYNLGVAGAKTWVRAGRPRIWDPAGAAASRDVHLYIARVQQACLTD